MKTKLKEILLVDDSQGTNSLNRRLLEEMGIVEEVSIALNGKLALDYLTSKKADGSLPNPELIFLDIRMPVMDGYQFLDRYHELGFSKTNKRIIIMLSSSMNDLDVEKSNKYEAVQGYENKPLTRENIERLLVKLGLD